MFTMLDKFFNTHKGVRRLALLWACWLVTEVVLRVTEPNVITKIGSGGASVVVAVIGLVGTAIGLYKYQRGKDDDASNH